MVASCQPLMSYISGFGFMWFVFMVTINLDGRTNIIRVIHETKNIFHFPINLCNGNDKTKARTHQSA